MKIKKRQCLKTVLVSMLVVPAIAMAIPTFSPQSGIPSQDETDSGNDIFSGGVAWIDYDNDGDDDVFIPNTSTGGSRFFRNDGSDVSQWSCSNYPLDANGNPIPAQFCDISQQAGTVLENLNSTAAVVADYDSDGCDDLFVTNKGANTLLRNTLCDVQPASTFFVDMTEPAGLSSELKSSYAASFGDIDNDGDLDLYVSQWTLNTMVCQKNDLYLNDGVQNGVTRFTRALAGEQIEVRTADSNAHLQATFLIIIMMGGWIFLLLTIMFAVH